MGKKQLAYCEARSGHRQGAYAETPTAQEHQEGAAGQSPARTHTPNSTASAAQVAAGLRPLQHRRDLLWCRFRFGSSTGCSRWGNLLACWRFWAPDRLQ